MITVYFIRHGQSQDQKTRVHQGTTTPLSSYGKSQASRVARRLSKLKKVDIIYSSPFNRTKETAQAISRILKKPIEYWDDIGEILSPTELVGVYYNTKVSEKIRSIKKEKEINPDWRYSDEESFNDQRKRGVEILRHLEEKHNNKVVICVSHGTIVKLILALILFGEKLKAREFFPIRDTFKMGNTGITMCKFFDDDGWKIISVNDTTHL